MEFRNTIEKALKNIDNNVYYGKIPESYLKEDWNYLVFGKSRLKPSGSSNINLTDTYWVAIIR